MSDGEFAAILKHATVWAKRRPIVGRYPGGRKVCPSDRKRRQRPSPAGRFRQVLVFLRFTGCRPGEATRLEWSDVDLTLQRHLRAGPRAAAEAQAAARHVESSQRRLCGAARTLAQLRKLAARPRSPLAALLREVPETPPTTRQTRDRVAAMRN
jgi:integrase